MDGENCSARNSSRARATRAWDRSYLPATDRGGFPIVPGDVLWVVASVAETVGD